jgi:hypothetical protein
LKRNWKRLRLSKYRKFYPFPFLFKRRYIRRFFILTIFLDGDAEESYFAIRKYLWEILRTDFILMTLSFLDNFKDLKRKEKLLLEQARFS